MMINKSASLSAKPHYTHVVIQQLAEQLEAGFENPEWLTASCLLRLKDTQQVHFLTVEYDAQGLYLSADEKRDTDAVIEMPLEVACKIVSDSTHLDYRDPDIIGAMKMTGNLNIVNHIAKALVRPPEITATTFEDASSKFRKAYEITQLTYLDNPDEMQILRTIAAKQPFIIRNAPTKTHHTQWSLAKLKRDYQDVMLRVRSANERETVGEFVDRISQIEQCAQTIIEGHTKAYTEGCQLPEAMQGAFLPQYFSAIDFTPAQIWLGSVPVNVAASSLHRDPLDGFLYQILGRKKVLMFAPDQAKYLYPMKTYNNYQPCWVKPEELDLDTYPLFAKAKPLELILEPGEILVQPAGWFHAVYCLDSPTFSVSYFLNRAVGVEY